MQESPERDLEAFNLRRTGRSFGAISRQLGYDSAPAATHAFFRVLAGRERSEQEIVRDEEHGRFSGTFTAPDTGETRSFDYSATAPGGEVSGCWSFGLARVAGTVRT